MIWCITLIFLSLSLDVPTVKLPSGYDMPMFGYGTASVRQEKKPQYLWALEEGYRLFDTASMEHRAYSNCPQIREAIEESGISRSDIFIISKNNLHNHGYQSTLDDLNRSLTELNTDYIDLFLIHNPRCYGPDGKCDGTWKDTWRAMEKAHTDGLVRDIGVSNFDIILLKELLSISDIQPALVQNYHDPLHQDSATAKFAKSKGIVYQSFSTLGRQHVNREPAGSPNPVLTHATVTKIANRLGKTSAQVVLRWAFQDDIALIPKSGTRSRIKENIDIFNFELTLEDMRAIQDMSASEVSAVFSNRNGDQSVDLYWVSGRGDRHVGVIHAGKQMRQRTHSGHKFIAKIGGMFEGEFQIAKGAASQYFEISSKDEL